MLFIDAATLAISASLIWRLVPPPAQEKTTDAAGGYLGGLREGVRLVWNDRLIRAVLAMVMVTNLLDFGVSAVLFPVYADRVLGGAADLGLIIGAFGVGSVLGALAYGAIGPRLPKRSAAYPFASLSPGIGQVWALMDERAPGDSSNRPG